MTLKYKVGDRVISNNEWDITNMTEHRGGVITEIVEPHHLVHIILGDYHPYRVQLDNKDSLGLYREEELEAVA